jgi:hypothetical protein
LFSAACACWRDAVIATDKRRRREARFDKRFKPHVREKDSLGMKTYFSATQRRKSSALVTKHARW